MLSANSRLVSQRVKKRVFNALPGSRVQLCGELDMPLSTVSYALRQLRAEGQIHIGAWHRTANTCRPAAIFHAGPGSDAVLPDRQQPYRARSRKRERGCGNLSPRVDAMVWFTAGRTPPSMGAR